MKHRSTFTLLIVITLFLLITYALFGAELAPNDTEKIADAIYKVEGGARTAYPYGIKSIKTTNPHQVCINTIRNNFVRWQKSSEPDYFEFLANRYCPRSADPQGNVRWKKNITSILGPEFIRKINLKKF